MQAINYRRVAIGGLLASVVLLAEEIVLIGSLRTRLMAARVATGMSTAPPNPVLAITELLLTGMFLVWMYAAIRPRFGAGALTAVRSGVAVWVTLGLIVTIHMVNDNFGLPIYLILVIGAGMLPSLVAANLAGAWAYREQD